MSTNSSSAPRDYSLIAPFYDTFFHRPLAEGHKKIGQLLRKEKKLRGNLSILEVGVGSGLTLSSLPAGSDFTGIDVSEEMLNRARQKAQEISRCEIDLKVMNAERLAMKNNSFDVVLAPSVLSATQRPMQVFKEMIRVTKRGGKIAVVTNLRTEGCLSSQSLRLLDPLTRRLIGFRMDMQRKDFEKFENIRLLEETRVNHFMGLSLSTYLLFERI